MKRKRKGDSQSDKKASKRSSELELNEERANGDYFYGDEWEFDNEWD